jgi:hypothetical protein
MDIRSDGCISWLREGERSSVDNSAMRSLNEALKSSKILSSRLAKEVGSLVIGEVLLEGTMLLFLSLVILLLMHYHLGIQP